MGKKLINIILFQVAWFIAVTGAASGKEWYGPLAVMSVLLVHFMLIENRVSEVILLLVAGTLGFCFDTAMSAAGVVTPRGDILPHPFSQPWMVFLWLNYASTLNVSLKWMKGRPLLAAVFGAVGGTFAYYSGALLGATIAVPDLHGIMILALGWGIMNPVLIWFAVRFQKKGPTEPQFEKSSAQTGGRTA